MQRGIALSWLLLVTLAALSYPYQADAYSLFSSRAVWNEFASEYPEAAQELLDKVERNLVYEHQQPENYKRGLDLGLNRGFSGSQSSKHLMGLAAANYAGGPGRRRRSEQA
ncbi:hypothetical protein QAD02_004977 [Eretmocerus hayati]|uniref:Uncharacterized protein n=1 Tax=Eretmocerus hayati TaxID=131215 RepID=A0ACC2NR82_9HYME|nr:hypothetical protein QAD02_004977 [Eretmocerus hayati]